MKNQAVAVHWRRQSVVFIIFSCCLYFVIPATYAQDVKPIYPTGDLREVRWSSNSQSLIFHDVRFLSAAQTWIEYNVTTQNMTRADEAALLQLKSPCDTNRVFPDQISPSGRFVALIRPAGSTETSDEIAQIGITDCRSATSRIFPDIGFAHGRILWSTDESSFLYIGPTSSPPETENKLVSHYHDGVGNAFELDLLYLHINGRSYQATTYDLSGDGQEVLMKLYDDRQKQRLFIFNTAYPDRSRFWDVTINVDTVVAAAFAPTDETKLWLLDDQGVIEYDLTSNQNRLLSDAIKSTDKLDISSAPAIFSPNAHSLALMTGQGLVVLDLSAEATRAEAATTPSTPEAHPDSLRRLWVTTDCPTHSVETLTWTIHNPNSSPVTVSVDGDGPSDIKQVTVPGGSVDQPGVMSFDRPARIGGTARIQIAVDGVIHDTRDCFVPLGPPNETPP